MSQVDKAGHAYGFTAETPEYLAEIEEKDGQVKLLLEAIERRPTRSEEEWLVVVTTDHGGE